MSTSGFVRIILIMALLSSSCSSELQDKTNVETTVDAAIQATISYPTPTPDVEATITASVEATITANESRYSVSDQDVRTGSMNDSGNPINGLSTLDQDSDNYKLESLDYEKDFEPNAQPATKVTPWGKLECPETEPERSFDYFPIQPEYLDAIKPMGYMAGSHVTPVDHIYLRHKQWGVQNPTIAVVNPLEGKVVSISRMPNIHDREDYFIVISHSCTLFTIFIHAGALAQDFRDVVGVLEPGDNWSGSAPVSSGEKITDAGKSTLDMMVADFNTTLPGFIVPEHYDSEPWKIHVVDVFDLYTEPLRSELLTLNPRKVIPYGGKIDYDEIGLLVGNWFLEGTMGYNNGVHHYWEAHLAFVYDYIDPLQIRISIGRGVDAMNAQCKMCSGVFGLRGNSPDPRNISSGSGQVALELVAISSI